MFSVIGDSENRRVSEEFGCDLVSGEMLTVKDFAETIGFQRMLGGSDPISSCTDRRWIK